MQLNKNGEQKNDIIQILKQAKIVVVNRPR